MGHEQNLKTVSDHELRWRLTKFLQQTRRAEADLIAHMAEFDARRLYRWEAASSMFAWCTEVFHLSEHEAYLRITVARVSREHPVLLDMLRDGRLHLSGICKLAPHLTPENRQELLKRAEHRSKRQIEELVAAVAPRPPLPATVRKLPERRGGVSSESAVQGSVGQAGASADPVDVPRSLGSGPFSGSDGSGAIGPGPLGSSDATTTAAELGPDRVPTAASVSSSGANTAAIEPVAPARFRIRFDTGAELHDKLERLKALMRSSVPDGDLAKIIDLAVTEKLERLEAKRFGKAKAPRKRLAETSTKPTSRHIPAAVRRVVEKRDGGRCTFKDARGRRCTRRHDLEFHHRMPYGFGGDHSPQNVSLMCRAHNDLMAESDYGRKAMARHRRPGRRGAERAAASGTGSQMVHAPRAPS